MNAFYFATGHWHEICASHFAGHAQWVRARERERTNTGRERTECAHNGVAGWSNEAADFTPNKYIQLQKLTLVICAIQLQVIIIILYLLPNYFSLFKLCIQFEIWMALNWQYNQLKFRIKFSAGLQQCCHSARSWRFTVTGKLFCFIPISPVSCLMYLILLQT